MADNAQAKKIRWWDGDATQRYWMELVKRKGWGSELISPDQGIYSHMWDVREGDIVLHWLGTSFIGVGKSGVYGRSIVAGPPESTPEDIEWSNAKGPGIHVPLTDFVPSPPILLSELDASSSMVMAVNSGLLQTHGSPLYFPFQDGSGGFRPREAYLAKMPKEVVDIVAAHCPEVNWDGHETDLKVPTINGQNGVRQRYAGFCADPVLKKAIEMQAVRQATAYYEASGYSVEDVGAHESYDLRVIRGQELRHVEVKGSQGYVQKIILTRNEVVHANEFARTDLVVVADIEWERHLDGSVTTSNGVLTPYPDWLPSPEKLKPLSYEYVLD